MELGRDLTSPDFVSGAIFGDHLQGAGVSVMYGYATWIL